MFNPAHLVESVSGILHLLLLFFLSMAHWSSYSLLLVILTSLCIFLKRYKILKPTNSFSFLRTTDVKSSGESDT